MDLQSILAYSIVGITAVYLIYKKLFKKKKNDKNCGTDCGCGK